MQSERKRDALRDGPPGFARLSGWLRPLWQGIDRGLRRALPGRCGFCLAPAEPERPWCQACFEALPWNLPACPSCAEPQPSGSLSGKRCGHCLTRPPAFVRARAPLRYEDEVVRLVQRFKFHASPRAGNVLLELLELGLPGEALAWPEALIPVPLHPARARERGFDQADWLAQRLAARHGLRLSQAQRRQHTRSQRGLDRVERYRNLRDGFEIRGTLPSRVALLDDVMTTGATLDALAQACRAAGACEVEAWAVARTPLLDE
ncbi:ComF family protein [Billgrantia sp. Q4P2]|uniref:double zinc ribbon domain-containing protein n=1 Tax=Billgrantia sp. Q4P2 TaxID=3463857 RepID=UPI004056FB5C